MSRAGLARQLADAAGTSVSRARRFIDQVGEQQARQALRQPSGSGARRARRGQGDSGAEGLSRLQQAGLAGGALGAGGLYLRRQDRLRAEAEAEQSENVREAAEAFEDADMGLDAALAAAGEADDGDFSPSDLVPSTPSTGVNDTLRLILTIIILLAIIYVVMDDGAPNINLSGQPSGTAGGDLRG